MRFLSYALLGLLVAAPALAQSTDTPSRDTGIPPAAPAAPAPAPATAPPPPAAEAPPPAPPAVKKKKHAVGHRMPLRDRFAAANTARDGKLTLQQAEAARWKYVVNHFAAIDAGGKGYITLGDIQAFARSQRALRHKPAHKPVPAAAPAAPSGSAEPPAPPPPPEPGSN